MRAKWWLLFSPSNFFAHFSHVAGLLVPVLCGSQPLLVLSIVLFYDVYVVFFLVLPMLPDLCASGLRCLVPALAAQFVQSQQSLIVGSASAVTACPAPALSLQGVGSQSFVPSLLFLFVGISSAAFYHFGLLSHPILLLFLAWVYFFGVYSGLGLRCCGPGYGSSLLLGGLSFPCPCCFSLAITTFSFCPGNLGFLDFLLGFLSLDFQCFAGSSEWVETYVSVLSCLLFGCAFVKIDFCEQLLLASAFEAPRSCLALALRFSLDGFMVRTRCPSISKFRLGFSFPSFGSGGTSFGDIL